MTHTINITTTNLLNYTTLDRGKIAGSVPIDESNNDRQSETAAETGNTCISETVKSTVKIPTTNLGIRPRIGGK